ncbi:class I SAM-dependent methyltransferase [Dactylosporangium vinaceum]|nr:class I SAM-dependent methyltransferase [Dactylosporangium vinaceum]
MRPGAYAAGDADEAAQFLAGLAGTGTALELGIGTGRVALPLAAHGVMVHGIEASTAMLEQLRAKDGATAVVTTLGDMTDVDVPGRFALVYTVFNTLFMLRGVEEQERCLRNVRERLDERGALVVEASVPRPWVYDNGQRLRVSEMRVGYLRLEAFLHDPVAQVVESQRVVITEGDGVRMVPVRFRYLWPSELDMMCRLAGLRRVARYGGWSEEPFTEHSERHVSVYRPERG